MMVRNYVTHLLRDWLIACGSLLVIAACFLALSSPGMIQPSVLWQMILAASAGTFYKHALSNTHELGRKAGAISFFSCALFANLTMIAWLWLFTTNTTLDKSMFIMLISVILVVEIMVHGMMYIDGRKEARQLNEKLGQYKQGGGKQN